MILPFRFVFVFVIVVRLVKCQFVVLEFLSLTRARPCNPSGRVRRRNGGETYQLSDLIVN